MKYLNKQRVLWFSTIVVLLLSACGAEEPCFSQLTNRFKVIFTSPNQEGNIVSTPFFFDEIRAVGALRPVFEPVNFLGVDGVDLTLNPNADTTTYVFYYEGGKRDTLQLAYKRNSRMISPDCGLEISFTDIVMLKEPFADRDSISVNIVSTEMNAQSNSSGNIRINSILSCISVETSGIFLGFFSQNDEGEIELQPRMVRRVTRRGSDRIYYSQPSTGRGLDSLKVNLNPDANEVIYIFENTVGGNDTLALTYGRRFPTVSAFCIPDAHFEEINVSHSTFDSVSVVSPSISEPTRKIDIRIIDFND